MYRSIIQSLTAIFLVFATAVAGVSQDTLYTFTFDTTLQGWTTVGIASADPAKAENAVWVLAPNGDAGTGAWSTGDLPIGSPSGGGALLFDSDGLDNGGNQGDEFVGTGAAPAPQRGEITSPALDFSNETTVILGFYQYYRYFANDRFSDFTTPNSSLEVSGDGGTTWTSYVLNEELLPNRSTRSSDVIAMDISEVAAGQSDVRVKFVWDGEYYYWLIDDVTFYNSWGLNLAILDYTNINNFQTPDFVMVDDTADLEVMIANQGDADITDSIMVWTRILDDNLDVVFSDTGYLEGLNLGDTAIWDFDEHWVPELLPQSGVDESYNVVYNVRMKGDTTPETIAPDDNLEFQAFLISDLSFRKVPGGDGFGFTGEVQEGTFEDFAFANYYELPASFTENLKITQIPFEAFSTDEDDPLVGKSVIGYVVKLPDDVVEQNAVLLNGQVNLVNFDFDGSLDALIQQGSVIGIGSYQFSIADDEPGAGPFNLMVNDFETNENPVILEPGNKYLIAIQYIGAANTIAQEISRSYKLYQISTLSYYPSFGGFRLLGTRASEPGEEPVRRATTYAENVAAIGVETEFVTAVDEDPLPEGSVKIYPNPASDFIQVDINFANALDATIFIADAQGKIIGADVIERALQEQRTYQMNRFPSGTYIVRVSTREGTKTEHVIVAH